MLSLDGAAWNGPAPSLHYAEGYLLAAWLIRSDEPSCRGLLREFLLQVARTQQYQKSFAATIGRVGIVRMQTEWVAWMRAWR